MRQKRQARVLFINDTARNGGPGRSLHSILKFLDPGVVHRSVVLPRPGPIGDLLAKDGVADEVRFEAGLVENPIEPWSRAMQRRDYAAPRALHAARAAGNVGRMGGALVRLALAVRRERFDLIYCNGTTADFAGGLVAAATGVPALWHVRYTGLPPIARRPHRALSASAAVKRIVCVSHAAAGLFAHCATKVAVLHNALDVDAFDPARVRGTLRAELDLPPDAVVFGSHGRVLRRKGYLEMIDAARLALDALDAQRRARVFFVVVGDTPDDFAQDHVAECKAAAARAGLGDRFRMLGYRPDVRPLVADFDVEVVPSVYEDPLPRSVIEAMALAKPVIAFGVGGVAEMLSDGVTGAVVAFEPDAAGTGAARSAVERMARAFVAYAADDELRKVQGAAARARVLEGFDARKHARAVESEILAACAMGRR
jgi:glycosyltransferase involved in cell wall biosynthesis